MDDYFICIQDLCQKENDHLEYQMQAFKGKNERYSPFNIGIRLDGEVYNLIYFARVRKPVLQPYATNLKYLAPTGVWPNSQARQLLFQGVRIMFKKSVFALFQQLCTALQNTNIEDLYSGFKLSNPETKIFIAKMIKLHTEVFRDANNPNFCINAAIMKMSEMLTYEAYPLNTEIKTIYENDYDLSELYEKYGNTGFMLESTQDRIEIPEKFLYIKRSALIKHDSQDGLKFCSPSLIPLTETGRRFQYAQLDPLHKYRVIVQDIHDILKFQNSISVPSITNVSQNITQDKQSKECELDNQNVIENTEKGKQRRKEKLIHDILDMLASCYSKGKRRKFIKSIKNIEYLFDIFGKAIFTPTTIAAQFKCDVILITNNPNYINFKKTNVIKDSNGNPEFRDCSRTFIEKFCTTWFDKKSKQHSKKK